MVLVRKASDARVHGISRVVLTATVLAELMSKCTAECSKSQTKVQQEA